LKVGDPIVNIRLDQEIPTEQQEHQHDASPQKQHPPSPPSSSSTTQRKEQHPPTDYNTISSPSGPIKILATPAVRRVARELNVDLSKVIGTGKDGRVTKEDLENYIHGRSKTPDLDTTPTPVSGSQLSFEQLERRESISGLRRGMVKTMTAANAVPLFGYCDEIQMDRMVLLRDEMKSLAEKKGIKLTYLPIILKATSLALKSYPVLNSSVNRFVCFFEKKNSFLLYNNIFLKYFLFSIFLSFKYQKKKSSFYSFKKKKLVTLLNLSINNIIILVLLWILLKV
jgi:2-oxoisovalerate dehydrogenase E2 component (dihydrolipoyl transacylase)